MLSPSQWSFDFRCVPTVKPKRPEVQNITLNQESNQVVIYIRTPYENEYIQVKNQLFQVLILSPTEVSLVCDFLHSTHRSHVHILTLQLYFVRFRTYHRTKSLWGLAQIASKKGPSMMSKCEQYPTVTWRAPGVNGVNGTVLIHLVVSATLIFEQLLTQRLHLESLNVLFFLLLERVKQTNINLDWTWGICTAIACLIILLIVTTVSLCKLK